MAEGGLDGVDTSAEAEGQLGWLGEPPRNAQQCACEPPLQQQDQAPRARLSRWHNAAPGVGGASRRGVAAQTLLKWAKSPPAGRAWWLLLLLLLLAVHEMLLTRRRRVAPPGRHTAVHAEQGEDRQTQFRETHEASN